MQRLTPLRKKANEQVQEAELEANAAKQEAAAVTSKPMQNQTTAASNATQKAVQKPNVAHVAPPAKGNVTVSPSGMQKNATPSARANGTFTGVTPSNSSAKAASKAAKATDNGIPDPDDAELTSETGASPAFKAKYKEWVEKQNAKKVLFKAPKEVEKEDTDAEAAGKLTLIHMIKTIMEDNVTAIKKNMTQIPPPPECTSLSHNCTQCLSQSRRCCWTAGSQLVKAHSDPDEIDGPEFGKYGNSTGVCQDVRNLTMGNCSAFVAPLCPVFELPSGLDKPAKQLEKVVAVKAVESKKVLPTALSEPHDLTLPERIAFQKEDNMELAKDRDALAEYKTNFTARVLKENVLLKQQNMLLQNIKFQHVRKSCLSNLNSWLKRCHHWSFIGEDHEECRVYPSCMHLREPPSFEAPLFAEWILKRMANESNASKIKSNNTVIANKMKSAGNETALNASRANLTAAVAESNQLSQSRKAALGGKPCKNASKLSAAEIEASEKASSNASSANATGTDDGSNTTSSDKSAGGSEQNDNATQVVGENNGTNGSSSDEDEGMSNRPAPARPDLNASSKDVKRRQAAKREAAKAKVAAARAAQAKANATTDPVAKVHAAEAVIQAEAEELAEESSAKNETAERKKHSKAKLDEAKAALLAAKVAEAKAVADADPLAKAKADLAIKSAADKERIATQEAAQEVSEDENATAVSSTTVLVSNKTTNTSSSVETPAREAQKARQKADSATAKVAAAKEAQIKANNSADPAAKEKAAEAVKAAEKEEALQKKEATDAAAATNEAVRGALQQVKEAKAAQEKANATGDPIVKMKASKAVMEEEEKAKKAMSAADEASKPMPSLVPALQDGNSSSNTTDRPANKKEEDSNATASQKAEVMKENQPDNAADVSASNHSAFGSGSNESAMKPVESSPTSTNESKANAAKNKAVKQQRELEKMNANATSRPKYSSSSNNSSDVAVDPASKPAGAAVMEKKKKAKAAAASAKNSSAEGAVPESSSSSSSGSNSIRGSSSGEVNASSSAAPSSSSVTSSESSEVAAESSSYEASASSSALSVGSASSSGSNESNNVTSLSSATDVPPGVAAPTEDAASAATAPTV